MSVGHLHVSFGEMSVHFSAHFLMGVFGFLGGVSVLFIFWILLDMSFAAIVLFFVCGFFLQL